MFQCDNDSINNWTRLVNKFETRKWKVMHFGGSEVDHTRLIILFLRI